MVKMWEQVNKIILFTDKITISKGVIDMEECVTFVDIVRQKYGCDIPGIEEKIKSENKKFNKILEIFDVDASNLKSGKEYAFTPSNRRFIELLLDEFTDAYFKQMRRNDFSDISTEYLISIENGFGDIMKAAGKTSEQIEEQANRIKAATTYYYLKITNSFYKIAKNLEKFFWARVQGVYLLPIKYQLKLLGELQKDYHEFSIAFMRKWRSIAENMNEDFQNALLDIDIENNDMNDNDAYKWQSIMQMSFYLDDDDEFTQLKKKRDELETDTRLGAKNEISKVTKKIDNIYTRAEKCFNMYQFQPDQNECDYLKKKQATLNEKSEEAYNSAFDEWLCSKKLRQYEITDKNHKPKKVDIDT